MLRAPDITVIDLIAEGGEREDDGAPFSARARFYRHFHNPLLPWPEAGLLTRFPFHLTPHQYTSSVRWMQTDSQTADDGGAVGGQWAWRDARRLQYLVLTTADAREREAHAADLFRALGQIMHLVVDASVPEHVRNDPHPFGTFASEVLRSRTAGNYEYWVSDQQARLGDQEFTARYLSAPIGPGGAFHALPPPPGEDVAKLAVARLLDADRYLPEAPDPNVTLSEPIGIAEFANANFFSEDTLAGADGQGRRLPYPRRGDLIRRVDRAPSSPRARVYLEKPPGQGLVTKFALAECGLQFRAATLPPYPCVDEAVWAETASHMLPRAVGYARGVLDYFFRGRVRILAVGFPADGLSITVQNDSIEPMEGLFEVYARHQKGAPTERRAQTVRLNDGRPLALGPGESATLPLPIPPGNPTAYQLLVFRGRLGAEEDAVVGRVFAVPHVEIIQDSYQASLTKSCRTESSSFRNSSGEGFSERLICTSTPTNHRVHGRIQTNFADGDAADPTDHAIERIEAVWIGGGLTPAPLTLDGVLYPSGVWTRGEGDGDPRSFSIVDPAPRGSRTLVLQVSLRDPEQDEFALSLATFAESENVQSKLANRHLADPWRVTATRVWRVAVPPPTRFRVVEIAGFPLGTQQSGPESLQVTSHFARRQIMDVSDTFETQAAAAARFAAIQLSPDQLDGPQALEWTAVVESIPPHPGMVEFWRAFVGHAHPGVRRVALSAR